MINFFKGFGARRVITHTVLAAATAGALYLTTRYAPYGGATYIFTLGFGYASLVLLCATLLIGPINLLRQRFNPVNLDLRRDVGIWSGITAVLHVVSALVDRSRGSILRFFFGRDGLPLINLTGASNWIGAGATVLIVLLLVISSDLSLTRLKGKRWKRLQRLNYALAVLVFLHTFLYQMAGGREQPFTDWTAVAVVIVLVIQLAGVTVYQRRKRAHAPRRSTSTY